MKINVFVSCNLMLCGIFSLCLNNQLFGQEKVNLSLGIGYPELLNAGVRFQLEQAQIGAGVGFLPLTDESLITFSGDFFYHFGGDSKLSDRRPWYGRTGLTYVRDESSTLIDKYLYLNARIGRDCNLSERIGIGIDAGAIFQLFNETEIKQPSYGLDYSPELPVLPCLGISFFYRI